MPTRARVNEIDLLRFLAALSVVFFHYCFRGYAAGVLPVEPYLSLEPVAKYGYLGVELFFMISGFVILMTAANGSLRKFVISRMVRLYPAFWACCTLTFAVMVAIGAPHLSATPAQYLGNMTMLSGFFGVPFIDGAYWSLVIELKFYALVAIVLLIGRIRQMQIFVAAWLIASIALELVPVMKLRSWLIVDYSPFFIGGAACFLIWSKGLSLARILIVAFSWCLATYQALGALPLFEKTYHTDMSRCAVSAIVASFFVVMLLVSLRRTGFFREKRWLLAGALTYPLYLLHQNIGYMIFNLAYPALEIHWLFWGTLLTIMGLAFAVYVFIEKRFASPLRNALDKVADRAGRMAPAGSRAAKLLRVEPGPDRIAPEVRERSENSPTIEELEIK